jgi:hypothetical protein
VTHARLAGRASDLRRLVAPPAPLAGEGTGGGADAGGQAPAERRASGSGDGGAGPSAGAGGSCAALSTPPTATNGRFSEATKNFW